MGWIEPEHEVAEVRRWFEARGLELAVVERANGTWRAVVTPADGDRGEASYADGGDPADAARRARSRHSTRQLRAALGGLADAAQSEVVQLLFAEMVVARVPGGRTRTGRRAALVSAVWMLDPKRRRATRAIGSATAEWVRLRARDGTARGELATSALSGIERVSGRMSRRLGPPGG